VAVAALLRRVDEDVESLYATQRALAKAHPAYADLGLQRRLDLLRMWHNQYGLLLSQRQTLERWMYVRRPAAPVPVPARRCMRADASAQCAYTSLCVLLRPCPRPHTVCRC
jgi:hypothetical protein